jgi:hypothetical protein
MQTKEGEKKSVIQLPPKTEKVELENEQEVHDGPNGPNEEEGLESLEYGEETPPQNLKSSTQKRRQLDMYNYRPYDFSCIFSLFVNINERRTVK